MGPLETGYSIANHAVLYSQNDRWGLGPVETIKSGHNVADVNAQNTDEGWDQERLVILMLKSPFWMH